MNIITKYKQRKKHFWLIVTGELWQKIYTERNFAVNKWTQTKQTKQNVLFHGLKYITDLFCTAISCDFMADIYTNILLYQS